MIGCEFSYQIWEKIEKIFAAQTWTRIKQLKVQLKNVKKNGLMNDFLIEIKKVTDQLAVIGSEVSTTAYIEAIFDG